MEATLRVKNKFKTVNDHITVIKRAKITEFSKKTKDLAKQVETSITEDHFISTLNLQLDILSLVTTESLFYQKSGKSIIGEFKRVMYFAKNLEKLKEHKSHHFSTFLTEAKCTDNLKDLNRYISSNGTYVIPNCGTLTKFEKSKHRVGIYQFKVM